MKKSETLYDKVMQSIKMHSFYACSYDYDRTMCTGRCDDYCRCRQIINTKIIEVKPDFIKNVIDIPKISALDKYCLHRLLISSGVMDKDNWEVKVVGGYYGDEIDGSKFSKENELFKNIENLLSLSNIDKIKEVLKQEYGYLLPKLEPMTAVSEITANINDIECFNEDYSRKLDKNIVDKYNDYTGLRAVCYFVGNKFRVIDGYHRMASARNIKMKIVDIILLST